MSTKDNCIILISNLFTPTECQELIQLSEKIGFQDALINTDGGKVLNTQYRNNSRVEFRNAPLSSLLWDRLKDNVPKVLDGKNACGVSDKFKCYRYSRGQRFNWHQDGSVARSMYEKSLYTCMVYLNQDFSGGTTDIRLPLPDQSNELKIVKPEAGLGLLFRHELVHRGAELIDGVKYVLRTDVLFRRGR